MLIKDSFQKETLSIAKRKGENPHLKRVDHGATFGLLWWPIVPGAAHQASVKGACRIFDLNGEAQVPQDGAVRPVQEHVLQLDVVVSEAVPVEFLYGPCDV